MMSVIQDKFFCKTDEKLDTKIREKLKANCLPSTKKKEISKKPAPLIAKPTSEVNVTLNLVSEREDGSMTCDDNSNSSVLNDCLSFPKRPYSRPTSPPIRHLRSRHPYKILQDSSGFVFRRNTSPGGSPDRKRIEVIKKRLKHVRTMRLYVFPRQGPYRYIFLISGEKLDQKFRVSIGPQECSCGKGPHCVHILFVMLKVLKVSENDARLYSSSLKSCEVESLIMKYEERRQKRFSSNKMVLRKKSFHSSSDNLSIHSDMQIAIPSRPSSMPDISRNSQEEEVCTVCQFEMKRYDDVIVCKSGCKQQFHRHCITVWSEYCKRENQPVDCPLCRRAWSVNEYDRDKIHINSHSRNARLSPISSALSSTSPSSSSSLSSACTFQNSSQNSFSLKEPAVSDKLSSPTSRSILLPISHTYEEMLDFSSEKCKKTIDNSNSKCTRFVPKYLLEKEGKIEEWVKIFGNETIKHLFSFDWISRETALNHLYVEITSVLSQLACEESLGSITKPKLSSIIICTCCEILSLMALDPVYKVYIACLRCFRGLLLYTVCGNNEDRMKLQTYANPLIKNLLIKCADGNRRISQLSLASLIELCRGPSGEFAVGRQTKYPAPNSIGGITYLLNSICEGNESANWQWYLGRLYALDKLIQEFPSKFYLCVQVYSKDLKHDVSDSYGYKLTHLERLISVLKFALKLINHNHSTIRKIARKVFILAARLTSHIPSVFFKICDLLSNVDARLEVCLKEKIHLSIQKINFLSELLDQVQKTSKDDETIIYTSLRLPEEQNGLGKKDSNCSSSHIPAKTLIINKLGQGLPYSDCFLIKSKSCNFAPPCFNHLQGKIQNQQKHKNDILSSLDEGKKIVKKQINETFHIDCKKEKHEASDKLNVFLHSCVKSDSSMHTHHPNSSRTFCGTTIHFPPTHKQNTVNLPHVPSIALPHCPVGDLIDLHGPSSTVDPHSVIDLNPKRDGNMGFFNKEIGAINTNKALNICEGVRHKSDEKNLPSVPGLTDVALEQFESGNILLGPNFIEDKQNYGFYIENVHWKRGQLLGTGAFSSCYQARDIKTGTIMAVKQVSFCRNSVEEQKSQMLAIRDEIILMLRLDHPNIVRMLGAILQGNHYNMFVEWMPGGSVANLLTLYGPFTEIVIMRYIKQVLAGLAYLHDNKILHRDLKGANLLVDSTGHHLRIGDFGAAARMASQRTVANEFKGQLLGTIAFMAPEVLRGEDYGRSCDVWSVGCIIIEMATTKPPWDAVNTSNDLALLYKIACSCSPPPIPTDLPKTLETIALKCLQPKSEDRLPAKALLQNYFSTH